MDQYCTATGDTAFFRERGAEMIIETARFWIGRMAWDAAKQRYVIRKITGTDEIHTGVDNNALTNHLARWHLARAARAVDELRSTRKGRALGERLGVLEDEIVQWRAVAARVYVPFDVRRGFHEQHDGYFRLRERKRDLTMTQMMYTGPVLGSLKPTKLTKQADTVLMYYLFPDDFPEEVRRRGWRHYEPRSTHASSLSRSVYAAAAAQVGLTDEAYRLFLYSAELDFGSQAESESGVHVASMGGTWQAAVMGFGGLGIRDGRPRFDPHLPKGWKGLSYRVKWRGKTIRVDVTRTGLRLRTEGGKLKAWVGGALRIIGPSG